MVVHTIDVVPEGVEVFKRSLASLQVALECTSVHEMSNSHVG